MADGGEDGNAVAPRGPARRRGPVRASLDADEFIALMHGSDPVRVELTRLENELRDKERELGEAQAEIRALRLSERAREKAVEEVIPNCYLHSIFYHRTDELEKMNEKLKLTESLLESKNLDVKRINDEKKAALAAQFAAEATLRRVHAAQKDDDMPPIEAILAPLEAELKLSRQEVILSLLHSSILICVLYDKLHCFQISKLQDDNRALDRLTKQKEAALLEAERTVQIAMAKAAMVDDLQNKNQELIKQIEICHEENKILDKLHRQKIAEVEKLSQTVRDLEEALLQGGVKANVVRDYERRFQEMNEEKRTLDRELARAKVTANRVATVVANEWKDSNDKVMPVKQWLEERRFLQGEMQQLRDKLAVAERTARSEAQLKEKYQLRLKVLEDGLRGLPSGSSRPPTEGKSFSNGSSRRLSLGGADNMSKLSPNGLLSRRSPSFHSRSSLSSSSSLVLKHAKGTSKSFDGGTRSLDRGKVRGNVSCLLNRSTDAVRDKEASDSWKGNVDERNECAESNADEKSNETTNNNSADSVSGFLYDMLQKEVISLRKSCHEKDQSLKDKDDSIENLTKKVDTLKKAMEVEATKVRREVAAMEKEVAAMRANKEQEIRAKRFGTKSPGSSQLLPGRYIFRNAKVVMEL
ncbi:Microtubule-associated protein 70-3 [Dichanthelium oligosanthes]|uniref:Microtubule-associated protein 70-3 n=1 Tax=Dichanthelium oligosanthes TaxID=888268 RepID=A0A1E5WJR0_9POAL|nr:Microtubule-associated protein 70-3 [Dichanthelium oligosanthes]